MPDIHVINHAPHFNINLDQLPLQRDWLDQTFNKHAYHCFPMAIVNRLGWGVSFPEDISFRLNTLSDGTQKVEVLSGRKYVSLGRENGTISFLTMFEFTSKKNISLLTMPVPNLFIRGASCISTVISTSVMPGPLEIVWKVIEPDIDIVIPKNTPVGSIIPISLRAVQDYKMILEDIKPYTEEENRYLSERAKYANEKNSVGNWSHMYRDAKDHLGNIVGEHELKSIKLKTIKGIKK